MASSKKIVVEVIGRDIEYASAGGGTSKQVKEPGGGTNLNALMSPTKSSEKEAIAKHLIIQKTYETIKNLTIKNVGYIINRRNMLGEDYMAQQDISNASSTIERVSGLATSIVSGAMIGSAIPGIGTAIGGLVGAFAYIGNDLTSTIQKYDQAYIQLNESNYESAFQRTRLGLNDNGRGTQN